MVRHFHQYRYEQQLLTETLFIIITIIFSIKLVHNFHTVYVSKYTASSSGLVFLFFTYFYVLCNNLLLLLLHVLLIMSNVRLRYAYKTLASSDHC